MRKSLIIILGVVLILLAFVAGDDPNLANQDPSGGYNLNGTGVYYENDYGKLEANPHTTDTFSKHTHYINITSYSKEVNGDLAFIVNDPLSSLGVYFWENVSHHNWIDEYDLTTINFTCPTNFFKDDPIKKIATCSFLPSLDDVTYNFSHQYKTIDLKSKTIWWDEPIINGGHYEVDYYYDWNKVPTSMQFLNSDFYYWIYSKPRAQNKIQQYKIEFETKPNSIGEFHLLTKNTADTFNTSLTNNDYVYLHPWWNSSWAKRKSFNVSSYYALIDFPTYIQVAKDSDMQGDYDDLRFTNGSCGSNGAVELSYEIENWTASLAHVWMKTNLSSGVNQFCMYYNNSGVGSGQDVIDVWSNNYAIVYHMDETSGNIIDSVNALNATPGANYNRTGSGTVDGGDGFDGTHNYDRTAAIADISDVHSGNSPFTFEVWFRSDTGAANAEDEMLFCYGDSAGTAWQTTGVMTRSDGTMRFIFSGGNDYDYNCGQYWNNGWHHFVGVYNTSVSSATIYFDGTVRGSATRTNASVNIDNAGSGRIGTWIASANYVLHGSEDEIRISNTARTAGWINMTYEIVDSQGSLVTFGAEENVSGGECTTITSDITLYKNVTSAGTCMTIGADNVTLDCANYFIIYATSGVGNRWGVYNQGYDNVTIKNCNLLENNASFFQNGILFYGPINYGNITNNTIITNGSSSSGIVFSDVTYLNVSHNTVITSGSSGSGLYFGVDPDHTTISYNTITTSGASAASLILSDSANYNTIKENIFDSKYLAISLSGYLFGGNPSTDNYFYNNTIVNQSSISFYVTFQVYNNYLLNTSVNKSKITLVAGATQNLTIQWYFRVNVSDGTSPVSGATVNVSNVNGINEFTTTTAANGLTGYFPVTDLIRTDSGSILYNNYTVQVNDTLYNRTVSHNVSSTSTFPFILNSCYYSSGDWLINCAHNCNLNENTNLGGNVLKLDGTGEVGIYADIIEIERIEKSNSCKVVKGGSSNLHII